MLVLAHALVTMCLHIHATYTMIMYHYMCNGKIYFNPVSEEEIEVSVVEMNRFFRLQRMISHAPQMLPSSEANQLHDNEAKLITDHMIHVRYIDCKCIFERDCGAKTVEVNPDVYTMKELRIHIVKAEEYDLRHDTIELYSKEGYPFNTNNVCTSKSKLVIMYVV